MSDFYGFWKDRALAAEKRLRDVIEDLVRDRDEISLQIRNANLEGPRCGNVMNPIHSLKLRVIKEVLKKLDVREGL